MAILTGNQGQVAFSATGAGNGAYINWADTFANVFEFTLTEANDEYDSTTFTATANLSDVTLTEYGLFKATGSLKAFLDKGTLPPSTVHAPGALPSKLTLTTSTGNSRAFSAQLFNITFETDRQSGLNVLDCDFESVGNYTIVRPAS